MTRSLEPLDALYKPIAATLDPLCSSPRAAVVMSLIGAITAARRQIVAL